MANAIDIQKLTLDELLGVVNLYPWYGGARMELCHRMAIMGALSENQLAENSVHIGSLRLLSNLVNAGKEVDCTDADAQKIMATYFPSKEGEGRKVVVVGGDYFSQKEYDQVRKEDDGIFSRFSRQAQQEGYSLPDNTDIEEFCTEALAKIYLEQDYPDRAISIYSKLSLRYPEKSVYFAALIEEINKNR